MNGCDICIQYIFASFNESLEDSSRYLISYYLNNNTDETLRKFYLWYEKEKDNYQKIIKENEAFLHTEPIEEEMKKHRNWKNKTSFTSTPTILINGYKLPKEYELEDVITIISKKNILQDINGRSTTPLGAESQSAEETVLLFNHSKQKL